MNSQIKQFNIRVYALILDSDNRVLLSDEFVLDTKMTKFPGGGMKFGEGTLDCLQREAMEEFGQPLKNLRHFYTTDFFQQALFYKDHQLISIYYLADFSGEIKFRISEKPFDFKEMVNGSQSFRWVSLRDLMNEDLSFPIDRFVAKKISEECIS